MPVHNYKGRYPIWEVKVEGKNGTLLLRASTRAGYTTIIRSLARAYGLTEMQYLRTGSN